MDELERLWKIVKLKRINKKRIIMPNVVWWVDGGGAVMNDAISIAQYICSRCPRIGSVQLQKLLYYAQGWSLAWRGQPLFNDEIQAWRLGPVVPVVYRWNNARSQSTPSQEAHAALSNDERGIVDAIIDTYHTISSDELIERTHNEMPWQKARAGLLSEDASERPISLADMAREFSQQSVDSLQETQIPKPVKPALSETAISREQLLALSDQVVQQWPEAISLLAQ